MNDAGIVVGFSPEANGLEQPTVWTTPSTPIHLSVPTFSFDTGFAYGINNDNLVVGEIENHAYVWEGGVATELTDLIPPGTDWLLLEEARGSTTRG